MTIKRRANAALFQIIDPDDQIVAGTWALTGPPVWLDLLHAPSMLRIVPLLGSGFRQSSCWYRSSGGAPTSL